MKPFDASFSPVHKIPAVHKLISFKAGTIRGRRQIFKKENVMIKIAITEKPKMKRQKVLDRFDAKIKC